MLRLHKYLAFGLLSGVLIACQATQPDPTVIEATLPAPAVAFQTLTPTAFITPQIATPTPVAELVPPTQVSTVQPARTAAVSNEALARTTAVGPTSSVATATTAPNAAAQSEITTVGAIKAVDVQLRYAANQTHTQTITVAGASYLKLHMTVFDIAAGDTLWIIDGNSGEKTAFSTDQTTGDASDPLFWTLSVETDTLILQLDVADTTAPHVGITIDKVAYGDPVLALTELPEPQPLIQNAEYQFPTLSAIATESTNQQWETPNAPSTVNDTRQTLLTAVPNRENPPTTGTIEQFSAPTTAPQSSP